MKRYLCALLVLAALLSCCLIPASGASTTLTITSNGKNPVSAPVGSEILFTVGLYAGEAKIQNGQANINYDSAYLSLIEYAPDGDVESYSFPPVICNSSLVLNCEGKNTISYNFTKAKGVGYFRDPSVYFVRFRFKVLKGGKTDISHIIHFMSNVNDVSIYHRDEPNPEINPYMITTVELPVGILGDADRDGSVTILDATLIQRLAAGDSADHSAAADVNRDSAVSLRDALLIRRYLARMAVTSPVGEWSFASES